MTEPAPPPWQHLSPWAVLLIAARGIGGFVRENLPLVLGAGAGAAFVEAIGWREVLVAAVLALGLAALLSLQYYRRFRFRLEDGVLRVQRGLFERRELKVGAAQVQNVAIEQPAYMRPFGVVRFSVDTPGSAAAEVDLPGIPLRTARDLREALGAARAAQGEAAPAAAAPAPEALYRLGPGALVLHGVVSNHAYLLAAALVPLLQPLERAARRHLGPWQELGWAAWAAQHPLLSTAAALLALLAGMVLLSVAAAVLRYDGYRLTREGTRYVQRSGLLARREQALAAPKLQSLEWVQTALGRALGRGHLVCRQYGAALPSGAEELGGSFLIPGLRPVQAERLAVVFWPGLATAPWRRVHPAWRRLQAARLGALLALGVLLGGWAVGAATGWALWGALAAVPPVAWLLAHLQWRALAWQYGAHYARVRRGLLGRRTTVFPLAHAQSVTLRQSWLQRRRGLASVQLLLAAGPVTVPYIAEDEARRLVDRVLYRVEVRGAGAPTI